MKFTYDQAADALDIQLLPDTLVSRTVQLDRGTLVDLDQQGRVVSIEVIRPARRWPLAEILERFPVDEESAGVLRSLWAEPKTYPFAEPSEVRSEDTSGLLISA